MNAWYYVDAWRKGAKSTWGTNPNWSKVASHGPIRTSEDNSKWWESHFWTTHFPNNTVRRFKWNGSYWELQPSPVEKV